MIQHMLYYIIVYITVHNKVYYSLLFDIKYEQIKIYIMTRFSKAS